MGGERRHRPQLPSGIAYRYSNSDADWFMPGTRAKVVRGDDWFVGAEGTVEDVWLERIIDRRGVDVVPKVSLRGDHGERETFETWRLDPVAQTPSQNDLNAKSKT